jgi:hypothetical protein
MIQEAVVLFRVEHFQKGARRITVDSTPNFINLVNEDERVFRPNSFQSLYDLSRQRPVAQD